MSEADAYELPNPLGGERLFWTCREHRIAYVLRGEGTPIVFVHSIHAAAWSMEWRNVVPALSEKFATFSLDLLGFGASAHPPLHFTSQLYFDLLRDFLREVVKTPAALIGCSLGATYCIAVAAHHPELVTRVCAIGPAGVTRLASRAVKLRASSKKCCARPTSATHFFRRSFRKEACAVF